MRQKAGNASRNTLKNRNDNVKTQIKTPQTPIPGLTLEQATKEFLSKSKAKTSLNSKTLNSCLC